MVRRVRVAIDGDRRADCPLGLVVFAHGGQHDAKQIEAGEMVRLLRQHSPELPFGVVEPPLLERGNGLRQQFVAGRHGVNASCGLMPNICAANCG